MRLIDEEYTRHPFYGIERMTAVLRRQGHAVNPKRIRRLMRLMGLEALYPKPNLSKPGNGHKIYPYLLRGVIIDRADQIWSTDITYSAPEPWFRLPRSHNGLVQPLCPELRVLHNAG
jgi:putative transposase